PFGVRVVLIEPGQFHTRLLENAVVGQGFRPSSAHWERSARFDEALKRLVPGGEAPGPEPVAELIHRAVYDPSPKLRYLAGEDAELIATTYRSMDFESYER